MYILKERNFVKVDHLRAKNIYLQIILCQMIIQVVINEKSERKPLGELQVVKHVIGFQCNFYCASSGG